MFENDKDILEFKPKYSHMLPQDWQDIDHPTIPEISATLDTLKNMYTDQVRDLNQNRVDTEIGEENLRNIATNYQSIKSILFQPR